MNIGRKPQNRPFGTPILHIAKGSVDGDGVAETPPEGAGSIEEIIFGREGCGINGDGAGGRIDGPGATPPFAAVRHSNGIVLHIFAEES